MKEFEGLDFVESIKKLSNEDYSTIYSSKDKVTKQAIKRTYDEFKLPSRNKTNNNAIKYLVDIRKIDKKLIYYCIKQGFIYEDYNGCVVFVGYDNEKKPRFASRRATSEYNTFKLREIDEITGDITYSTVNSKDVYRSNKEYPFAIKGISDTLFVFEAPIDLLSFITLMKRDKEEYIDHSYLSMGGLNYISINAFLSKNTIKKIIMCIDNDKAGDEFYVKVKERYKGYEVKRIIPTKGKDFNEELINIKKEEIE